MYWKKIKNEICVEVLAMDEEGTKNDYQRNRWRQRCSRNLHEHL